MVDENQEVVNILTQHRFVSFVDIERRVWEVRSRAALTWISLLNRA